MYTGMMQRNLRQFTLWFDLLHFFGPIFDTAPPDADEQDCDCTHQATQFRIRAPHGRCRRMQILCASAQLSADHVNNSPFGIGFKERFCVLMYLHGCDCQRTDDQQTAPANAQLAPAVPVFVSVSVCACVFVCGKKTVGVATSSPCSTPCRLPDRRIAVSHQP